MKEINGFAHWQFEWGVPRGLFYESERKKLEAAFLLAFLFHLIPFGLVWHQRLTKKVPESVTLQNVDLIEPETEQPPAPPPVAVQKPKNALEFLKMALPIFRKKETVPEMPREIITQPKVQEPKIAEPERLIERKMVQAPVAPEIKLDAAKNLPAPKIMEIAKLPQSQRVVEPRAQEPALKLEEVGRRAVAPPPPTPSISLESSLKPAKAMEIVSLPKTKAIVPSVQSAERLVEKTIPATAYKSPALSQNLPLGYEKRGGGSVSLGPREVVRTTAKPQVESAVPKSRSKEEPATLQISKERVKITGPLSSRKVLKYFVPEYPAWARDRNIEADVAIRFTVSAGGDVLGAVVERTSGYSALDKSAMEELKKWKFSRISSKEQDQWGVITFRFLLE